MGCVKVKKEHVVDRADKEEPSEKNLSGRSQGRLTGP
jgi:hypothetical protein